MELQLSLFCYTKVLLKRLCDGVALVARGKLMLEPSEKVHEIFAGLTDEQLERAMAEPADVKKKRTRHEQAVRHLTEAQAKLNSGLF